VFEAEGALRFPNRETGAALKGSRLFSGVVRKALFHLFGNALHGQLLFSGWRGEADPASRRRLSKELLLRLQPDLHALAVRASLLAPERFCPGCDLVMGGARSRLGCCPLSFTFVHKFDEASVLNTDRTCLIWIPSIIPNGPELGHHAPPDAKGPPGSGPALTEGRPSDNLAVPDQGKKAPLGLRLIAAVKIAKGFAYFAISLGLFDLVHKDLSATALHFVHDIRISPENHYVELLLEKIGVIKPRTVRLFGELSILEGAIQLVEGFGLWYGAIWAEYVVVISSGLFIPEECIAIWNRFTWTRVAILAVNAAIFAYMALMVWKRHLAKQASRPASA
jgi:uncharacterized membrane protein (DUF2068 family)